MRPRRSSSSTASYHDTTFHDRLTRPAAFTAKSQSFHVTLHSAITTRASSIDTISIPISTIDNPTICATSGDPCRCRYCPRPLDAQQSIPQLLYSLFALNSHHTGLALLRQVVNPLSSRSQLALTIPIALPFLFSTTHPLLPLHASRAPSHTTTPHLNVHELDFEYPSQLRSMQLMITFRHNYARTDSTTHTCTTQRPQGPGGSSGSRNRFTGTVRIGGGDHHDCAPRHIYTT